MRSCWETAGAVTCSAAAAAATDPCSASASSTRNRSQVSLSRAASNSSLTLSTLGQQYELVLWVGSAQTGPVTTTTEQTRTGSTTAPTLAVLLGLLCLSVSPILVGLAPGIPAATVATLRCALALIPLVPLAWLEVRRRGAFDRRARWIAIIGGVFLGADYVAWAQAVHDSGAGVTTVLINVQVVVLPLLALLLDKEPVRHRFWVALPLMLAGVGLVGLGGGSGSVSVRGVLLGLFSGITYGVYMYALRRAGAHAPHTVTPVAWATAGAAGTAGAYAVLSGASFRLEPAGWGLMVALALLGQTAPWLLIGRAARRLEPAVAGSLMLAQPVLAVLLGVLVLGERVGPVQLLGCLVTVISIGIVTLRAPRARR
ncbi:EamA family transporter [Enemella evansiae]|nr:EamA family transporter [Enemella evansiae]